MGNWIDNKSEAHLEATEWFSFGQEGFPDAVIFANDGSVLDGTYEQVRYIQDQRYEQLAEVAREMITALEVAYIATGTNREWNSCVIKGYKKRLEELGVEV